MRTLVTNFWAFTKIVFGLVVFVPFALLLILMFFGGPIAIIAESYDILCCNEYTDAVLTDIQLTRGGKGTSGVRVAYNFKANGKQFESHQLYPGFAGNLGNFTGASMARQYAVGQQYPVFYSSSLPSHSFLERGWHKWSIGWTAWIWGMVTFVYFRLKGMRLWIVSMAAMLYAFALIGFGPHTIQLGQLHWHLLAVFVCGLLVVFYAFLYRNRGEVDCEAT